MKSAGGVVAIVGATATGKTALANAMAEHRGDMELVNADSRQVLRGLRVATFAPVTSEGRGVPAHLFDVADPGQNFTVAEWVGLARPCIHAISLRGNIPCVVGGTGLYVRALLEGWTLGSIPADARRRADREAVLGDPGGLGRLVAELAERDPDAAATIDRHNPRRVVRALELVDAGRVTARGRPTSEEPVPAVRIALDVPRDLHRELVCRRADSMFSGGALMDEVSAALARGVSANALGRAGIGYREAIDVLDGRIDVTAARAAVIRRTLRYAKAQRTWFRGDATTTWLRWSRSPLDVIDEALGLVAGAPWLRPTHGTSLREQTFAQTDDRC